MLKTAFKRAVTSGAMTLAPRIQIPGLQDWLIKHVFSRLLDADVIPRKRVPRRMWRLDAHALCNPYAYHHARPFWFGRLHEIHVERYLRRALKPGDTLIDVGCSC